MDINEQKYEELRQLYITNTKTIENKLKLSKVRNIATIAVFTAAMLGLTAMHYNTKLEFNEVLKELKISEEKWKEIVPPLKGINTNLALLGARDSITIQGITYQRDVPDEGESVGGEE